MLDGIRRLVDGQFSPLERDGSGGMGPESEQSFHQFCSLGTHQARNAEDLSLLHVEVYVAETLGVDGGEVLHLEYDFAGNVFSLREQVGQLAAHHLGDDEVRRQVLGFPGADVLSVTHDGDFIADP